MADVLFLGTGAADIPFDTVPEPHFENKSFRRCSAALVNGHILLDGGPFVLSSLETAGISPAAITDVVFTHLHRDHFDPATVAALAAATPAPLRLWVREDADIPAIPHTALHRMTLFSPCTVGETTVTGVPANHTRWPQYLLIETAGRKLLYATDGAWMLGETVERLKGAHLDMLVLDATVGDYTGDLRMGEHNSIPMIRLMLPSLRTLGVIDAHTRVILTHLAMSLHKSHEETAAAVKDEGVTVAFDGLQVAL